MNPGFLHPRRLLGLTAPLLVTAGCGTTQEGDVYYITAGDTGNCCCITIDCCPDDTDTDTDDTADTGTDITCDDFEPAMVSAAEPEVCYSEPAPADIDPVVAWAWPDDFDPTETHRNVVATPMVGHILDSDGDGSPNNIDDTPEVVFVAYDQSSSDPGRLVVLDPVTRQVVWTLDEVVDSAGRTAYFSGASNVAIGDVDGNGDIEICAPTLAARYSSGTQRNVVCVNGEDGSLLWLSDNERRAFMGSPAIANLDGAGAPEVIIGNVVLSGVDGTTLAQAGGSANMGGWGYEESNTFPTAISVPIQLDDGNMEIIAAGSIWTYTEDTSTGTFSLVRSTVTGGEDEEGFASVADVDLDGEPEIVRTRYVYDGSNGRTKGYVRVLDRNASGTWELAAELHFFEHYASGSGSPTTYYNPSARSNSYLLRTGPPTLANLDSDPELEIAVAGAEFYQVLDVLVAADGSISLAHKWQRESSDASSASTGSSVFDFDADGVSEILYADQRELYIFDGPTGADRIVSSSFDPKSHCSGTATELPSIADVDNDGASEILLASAWAVGDAPTDWPSWDPDCTDAAEAWQGVRMIQSATDDGTGNGWAPSRPVWNQHAYNVSNVNDDSTIPTTPAANWDTWNSFRKQDRGDRNGAWKPNLVSGELDVCSWTCDGDVVSVYYSVTNDGVVDATDIEVELRTAGGTTRDAQTLSSIASGDAQLFGPVELTRTEWGSGLLLVVDPNDDIAECNEDDNVYDGGEWPCD